MFHAPGSALNIFWRLPGSTHHCPIPLIPISWMGKTKKGGVGRALPLEYGRARTGLGVCLA